MDFVVCGEFTKLLSCSVAGGLSSQLAMDLFRSGSTKWLGKKDVS